MALRGSTKLEHRLEQMLMMLMVTMRKEQVPSFFFRQTQILLATLNVICWARADLIGFYADVCHSKQLSTAS